MKFDTIDYLQTGNERQQRAYDVLTNHRILAQLAPFSPVLVGTIPINIDIESSDLDVICQWSDKSEFATALHSLFGHYPNFTFWENPTHQAVVAHFIVDGFEIEVFGQNIPIKNQNAYRHMLVEDKLLAQHGETFRQQIVSLKQQGYKTEPAFALALGLEGDPYLALLALEV
ncbi:DUF4269 domain-containing protein [Runella sp. SP2]|uniref:DUF4269 domain-containing protein n=1 Tax=Runella sp. SP2 TaxID=2268026 RepID=UPI000F07B88D|nr:DUF4269 domain-containing protein [Runella sp. SP2]AYQ33619.1 DUF4269 domain-containing protein [Runella sp. SP2]